MSLNVSAGTEIEQVAKPLTSIERDCVCAVEAVWSNDIVTSCVRDVVTCSDSVTTCDLVMRRVMDGVAVAVDLHHFPPHPL